MNDDRTRPCTHCKGEKDKDHRTLSYRCNIESLPLQWQQMYYESHANIAVPNYVPMGNLEYLEWKHAQQDLK